MRQTLIHSWRKRKEKTTTNMADGDKYIVTIQPVQHRHIKECIDEIDPITKHMNKHYSTNTHSNKQRQSGKDIDKHSRQCNDNKYSDNRVTLHCQSNRQHRQKERNRKGIHRQTNDCRQTQEQTK